MIGTSIMKELIHSGTLFAKSNTTKEKLAKAYLLDLKCLIFFTFDHFLCN